MPKFFRRPLLALALALPLLAGSPLALAQDEERRPTVDLSAEASRRAPNDLAFAVAYVEESAPDPARLAKRVNEQVAAALSEAKRYPDVSTQTSGVHTYPVYGKDGRRIEGWRMRSEIQLESRNLAALSELLGRLQGRLAVSRLNIRPASETERATADKAATDAIHAFEARAKTLATTLGKHYRIRHLSVNYGRGGPVQPMMRAMSLAEDTAAVPIEAGDSEVTVTVTGTIELID